MARRGAGVGAVCHHQVTHTLKHLLEGICNYVIVDIWAAMPWRDIPSKSGNFFSKFEGSPLAQLLYSQNKENTHPSSKLAVTMGKDT